jgi:hypothetical protein
MTLDGSGTRENVSFWMFVKPYDSQGILSFELRKVMDKEKREPVGVSLKTDNLFLRKLKRFR